MDANFSSKETLKWKFWTKDYWYNDGALDYVKVFLWFLSGTLSLGIFKIFGWWDISWWVVFAPLTVGIIVVAIIIGLIMYIISKIE